MAFPLASTSETSVTRSDFVSRTGTQLSGSNDAGSPAAFCAPWRSSTSLENSPINSHRKALLGLRVPFRLLQTVSPSVDTVKPTIGSPGVFNRLA